MNKEQESAIRRSQYALQIAECYVDGITILEQVSVLTEFLQRRIDAMRYEETRNNEGEQ